MVLAHPERYLYYGLQDYERLTNKGVLLQLNLLSITGYYSPEVKKQAEKQYDETELRKVDVQITRLRQKIETNPKQPQFIKTIRSKGYKLICNEI